MVQLSKIISRISDKFSTAPSIGDRLTLQEKSQMEDLRLAAQNASWQKTVIQDSLFSPTFSTIYRHTTDSKIYSIGLAFLDSGPSPYPSIPMQSAWAEIRDRSSDQVLFNLPNCKESHDLYCMIKIAEPQNRLDELSLFPTDIS